MNESRGEGGGHTWDKSGVEHTVLVRWAFVGLLLICIFKLRLIVSFGVDSVVRNKQKMMPGPKSNASLDVDAVAFACSSESGERFPRGN